ncbi:MAG: hypothetical protein JJT75_07790 [Opitutales bacterium]|nr:hypothetical protein [Opitutales bacterium]
MENNSQKEQQNNWAYYEMIQTGEITCIEDVKKKIGNPFRAEFRSPETERLFFKFSKKTILVIDYNKTNFDILSHSLLDTY